MDAFESSILSNQFVVIITSIHRLHVQTLFLRIGIPVQVGGGEIGYRFTTADTDLWTPTHDAARTQAWQKEHLGI